jgi:periplasmic protein TonB
LFVVLAGRHMLTNSLPDVFTIREVAAAAGVTEGTIRDLLAGGAVRTVAAAASGGDVRWQGLLPHDEAVRVVRAIRAGDIVEPRDASGLRPLLASHAPGARTTTMPLLVSTSLHVAVVVALLVISSLGLTNADEKTDAIEPDPTPTRMVYLALPGPGGGGGGGGMKMRTPPPKAERQGPRKVSSPIPARRLPPPITPPPRPKPEPPPPPLEAKTLPPVMAPVAPIAADTRNQEGVMKELPKEALPSQGAGTGGGAGSGQGTGLGEGTGSGIGPGEGGGIGGGPYRPGSGVEPPRLLKEVRADYTDQARRANVSGEVVLEIVVRRDGSVGDVRVLQRLGSGLEQRAIDAVRQWRFAPARLKGTPVDVIVEVAVEFKLR